MNVEIKRGIAGLVFPRRIETLAMVNEHAGLMQWLRRQNAPQFATREDLYSLVNETVGSGALDYLEFGVHTGESFRFWLRLNTDPGSRFVGFDTFTGLPSDWGQHLRQGHFDVRGVVPEVNDARAEFVTGLFQDTLPTFLATFKNERQLIIHNDSDLYSSTLYTLATLNDWLKPGTVLIFDEFASPLHEYRAWNDYTAAFMRSAKLLGYVGKYAIQAAFRFE